MLPYETPREVIALVREQHQTIGLLLEYERESAAPPAAAAVEDVGEEITETGSRYFLLLDHSRLKRRAS